MPVLSRSADHVLLDESDFVGFSDCVTAIGSPEFPELLSRLCAKACNADLIYLSAFFEEDRPVEIFNNHTDQKFHDALDVYTNALYVLDPFYERFKTNKEDKVLGLKQIAPDNFTRSEYYQRFYKDMHLSDECGLMVRIDATSALFFSMALHDGKGRTDPEPLAKMLPLVAALARRHWTVLTPERTDGTGRFAAHLEAAFPNFGSTLLSPREGEILRMIMRGHSSKAIARVFGNSPETIKVHRRRIYNKMDIASQGELLNLFISALSTDNL